jgi:hypothetical protein
MIPKIVCILLKISFSTLYAFGGYRHFTVEFLQYGTPDSWALDKVVRRPEVLPCITSVVNVLILQLYLVLYGPY